MVVDGRQGIERGSGGVGEIRGGSEDEVDVVGDKAGPPDDDVNRERRFQSRDDVDEEGPVRQTRNRETA